MHLKPHRVQWQGKHTYAARTDLCTELSQLLTVCPLVQLDVCRGVELPAERKGSVTQLHGAMQQLLNARCRHDIPLGTCGARSVA